LHGGDDHQLRGMIQANLFQGIRLLIVFALSAGLGILFCYKIASDYA
jgi:hypothetical protein